MGGGTLALLLLALGLISFGVALRPKESSAAGRIAAKELEEAVARASDLVSSAKSLGRELEDTGMAVAEQAGQHLRALKSAVADADKQLEALSASQHTSQKPVAVADVKPPPAASGARLDVSVEDSGVREIAPAGPGSDRHAAIYGLADEGRTVDEIAQALDLGKGEVQLILSLRRPV